MNIYWLVFKLSFSGVSLPMTDRSTNRPSVLFVFTALLFAICSSITLQQPYAGSNVLLPHPDWRAACLLRRRSRQLLVMVLLLLLLLCLQRNWKIQLPPEILWSIYDYWKIVCFTFYIRLLVSMWFPFLFYGKCKQRLCKWKRTKQRRKRPLNSLNSLWPLLPTTIWPPLLLGRLTGGIHPWDVCCLQVCPMAHISLLFFVCGLKALLAQRIWLWKWNFVIICLIWLERLLRNGEQRTAYDIRPVLILYNRNLYSKDYL